MYYSGDLRKEEMKDSGPQPKATDRAREEWTGAERRLRQRMQVYPQKPRDQIFRSMEEPGAELEKQTATVINMGKITPQPKKIVSIRGQDVDEKELT